MSNTSLVAYEVSMILTAIFIVVMETFADKKVLMHPVYHI